MSASGMANLVSFLGIGVGMSLGGDDPAARLQAFTLWGLGTLGLVSSVRHILFAGELSGEREAMGFANSTFFEWEAGFANLAFGVVAILTSLGTWGVPAMAAVGIGYVIYLLGAAATHFAAGWQLGTLRRALIYAAMVIGIALCAAFRILPALAAA